MFKTGFILLGGPALFFLVFFGFSYVFLVLIIFIWFWLFMDFAREREGERDREQNTFQEFLQPSHCGMVRRINGPQIIPNAHFVLLAQGNDRKTTNGHSQQLWLSRNSSGSIHRSYTCLHWNSRLVVSEAPELYRKLQETCGKNSLNYRPNPSSWFRVTNRRLTTKKSTTTSM